METEELKILLALEPTWTVSRNGVEFQTMHSTEILLDKATIRIGKWKRNIDRIEWLRPNVVRIRGRQRMRTETDVFTLYPGPRLPSRVDLRRRRRTFQVQLGRALKAFLPAPFAQRQMMHSDRRHGIGGAYPRFLAGNHAVIAVDPDEAAPTVNAVMSAALLWSGLIKRRVTVIVPKHRAQTIRSRLEVMTGLRAMFDWLEWDGESIAPLSAGPGDTRTEVHAFDPLDVREEVSRLLARFPGLQPVPNIAGRAVSLRFRGIDVAQVREDFTAYPLGEPLERVVAELETLRRFGSHHPIARAHEERWLESNLIGEIGRLVPSIDPAHIYPQVPSFVGEERNIIDLLAVTRDGRLVVMEIKASPDPDLPFQALDYWIAVERHRKSGDFQRSGYFRNVALKDQPALLILVAPLLAFHRTLQRLVSVFPQEVPLLQIGLKIGRAHV